MKKFFTLLVILALTATSLFAQSKMSNGTSFLVNAPSFFQSDNTIRNVNGVQMTSLFITFNGAIDRELISSYGGTVQSEFPDQGIVTAIIPVASIEPLSRESAIRYLEVGYRSVLTMDSARVTSNADKVITGADSLSQSYLGRGVIIGIIDQGIQLDHPAFWNTAHNRYRIKAFWDQAETGSGNNDYSYGAFYMDSASILNKKYDSFVSTNGHATHVVGIAAGADKTRNYYGIAQEADLVVVSCNVNLKTPGLVDAVKWIFHYADSVGKPCVINRSMCTILGPHDGESTGCNLIDPMLKSGHILINGSGNDGFNARHLSKTFSATDTMVKTMIQYSSNDTIFNSTLDIWGDAELDYRFAFVLNDILNDSIIAMSKIHRSSTAAGRYYIDTLYVGGKDVAAVVCQSEHTTNGKYNTTLSFQGYVDSLNMPGLIIYSDSGTVNVWANGANFDEDLNSIGQGWTAGDCISSVGGDIESSNSVVTVGSYASRYDWYMESEVGDISIFSSPGPTIDGRIKPEIAAPGELIYSAWPDIHSQGEEIVDSTVVGGTKYYYGADRGTSMATPYVAGVVATWLEADPTLDYDRIIDIFQHTAIHDSFTGNNLPDNDWGYGKIDAYRGLLYLLRTTDVQNVSQHQIVGIYPNPTTDAFYVGFASNDTQVTLSVIDLNGRTLYSKSIGDVTAGEELSFSLAGIPSGSYMVRITGATHNQTYKLIKK